MMNWEKSFLEALASELAVRREKNPRYSIRAYARDLNVAPATLSELLRGQTRWKLGPDRAIDMLTRMNLSPARRRRLTALIGGAEVSDRADLPSTEFDLLTDWKTAVIYFAHGLPPAQRAPENLSARFNITVTEVESICESLRARGLLRPHAGGYLEDAGLNWAAEKTPPPATIRAHHRAGLERAASSIESIPPTERDLSALTFVGSLKNLDEIRKEIRGFHERIRDLMNHEDENGEVLQLSIALFPLRGQKEAGV